MYQPPMKGYDDIIEEADQVINEVDFHNSADLSSMDTTQNESSAHQIENDVIGCSLQNNGKHVGVDLHHEGSECVLTDIGKTEVFLRAGQMVELDACRAEVLGKSAIIIQKKARSFICQKQYNLLRFFSIEVERAVRGQLARDRYERMKRDAASLIIQKQLRMYLSKSAYKTTYARAVCIQAGMRGMTARNDSEDGHTPQLLIRGAQQM